MTREPLKVGARGAKPISSAPYAVGARIGYSQVYGAPGLSGVVILEQ
jgi:hypothetical protein